MRIPCPHCGERDHAEFTYAGDATVRRPAPDEGDPAAWMRYVTGVDEKGSPIDVRDPLAPRLRSIAERGSGSPAAIVDGLLGVSEVFGADLPRNKAFRTELVGHLSSLFRRGAIETVRNLVRGTDAAKG